MEGYDKNDPPCSASVQGFVSAWVDELHALGYLAGVYGSAASTIRDLQALAATASSPDDIWIGDWNGVESVFGRPLRGRQRSGRTTSGCTSTAAGITRPGAASRSTSTRAMSTPPSSAP